MYGGIVLYPKLHSIDISRLIFFYQTSRLYLKLMTSELGNEKDYLVLYFGCLFLC